MGELLVTAIGRFWLAFFFFFFFLLVFCSVYRGEILWPKSGMAGVSS